MQIQSKIFIGVGVIVLIFIGYQATKDSPEDVSMMTSSNVGSEQDEISIDDSAELDTMDANMELVSTEESPSPELGKYLLYDEAVVASSNAENVILSFSATWCPSCRTLDNDITANLGNIPAGTEIYKVDYDTNVALRQKYGVTTQHTLVVIDKNGDLIKKWSGGNTLQQLLAQI